MNLTNILNKTNEIQMGSYSKQNKGKVLVSFYNKKQIMIMNFELKLNSMTRPLLVVTFVDSVVFRRNSVHSSKMFRNVKYFLEIKSARKVRHTLKPILFALQFQMGTNFEFVNSVK